MSLVVAFSKLCVSNAIKGIQRCSQQQFHMTPVVCAEPMKKRKRVDPAILRSRLERKKKKIEKQIRRLKKNSRQYKPIEEVEKPRALLKEEDQIARKRPAIKISEEQQEQRDLLHKEWSRYRRVESIEFHRICLQALQSQKKALAELRNESEELYQAAIQPDDNLSPYTVKGPDGDYKDVSKKWE